MCAKQPWTIGLLLTNLFSTAVPGQQALPMNLSIVTYDGAHVGPKTLRSAEHLAATILATAGIDPSWDVAPARDLQNLSMDFTAYGPKDCQAEPAATVLRVQILPRAPVGFAPYALGFSLPCARSGVQVTIYADRVASVSETGAPSFGRVLGYAIAHELGHVFLHSGAHAPEGLMKAVWSKGDWQRAAVDIIPFSPAEARQIAALHKRAPDTNVGELASLNAH